MYLVCNGHEEHVQQKALQLNLLTSAVHLAVQAVAVTAAQMGRHSRLPDTAECVQHSYARKGAKFCMNGAKGLDSDGIGATKPES